MDQNSTLKQHSDVRDTLMIDHIDARTEDEREAGTIKLDILYDKTQYYMG